MKLKNHKTLSFAAASLLLTGVFVFGLFAYSDRQVKQVEVAQVAAQNSGQDPALPVLVPAAEAPANSQVGSGQNSAVSDSRPAGGEVKANAAPAQHPAAGWPDPVTLRIPSIKLTAPIVKTGLEADGSLHVPSSPDMTGWYKLGPRPGEVGPAVITGHLDSKAGPGVLYNLKNVKPGDLIEVVRDDGAVAVFVVERSELYPQENFNTEAVYGAISHAGLRLITCAGTYSKVTGHYSDDLVVYASLKEVRHPAPYEPL